jgi:hypothetical protein
MATLPKNLTRLEKNRFFIFVYILTTGFFSSALFSQAGGKRKVNARRKNRLRQSHYVRYEFSFCDKQIFPATADQITQSISFNRVATHRLVADI